MLGTRPLAFLRLDLSGARERLLALMADSGLDVPPDRRVSRLSRRREAAARDPQGALSRRAHPRARRADRGAHPAGGRRPVRRAAPARGERALDHLHLAQAERGAGDRRPHRGAARRAQGRGPRGRGRRPRDARRADGRARGGAEPPHAARAGRAAAGARPRDGDRSARPRRAGGGVAHACTPARSSASPAFPATGRARSPASSPAPWRRGRGRSRSTASRSPPTPRASIAAGIGRIPEDRHHEGIVGALSIAENLALETCARECARRLPAVRRDARARRSGDPRLRRALSRARTRRSGCSPAAISRR